MLHNKYPSSVEPEEPKRVLFQNVWKSFSLTTYPWGISGWYWKSQYKSYRFWRIILFYWSLKRCKPSKRLCGCSAAHQHQHTTLLFYLFWFSEYHGEAQLHSASFRTVLPIPQFTSLLTRGINLCWHFCLANSFAAGIFMTRLTEATVC